MSLLNERIKTLKERYKDTGQIKWYHRLQEAKTIKIDYEELREKLWDEYRTGLDSPPD
jgi:hypothetical protein